MQLDTALPPASTAAAIVDDDVGGGGSASPMKIEIQSCIPVLSHLFDPAGRTRHNHEAAGRTSKLKSND